MLAGARGVGRPFVIDVLFTTVHKIAPCPRTVGYINDTAHTTSRVFMRPGVYVSDHPRPLPLIAVHMASKFVESYARAE